MQSLIGLAPGLGQATLEAQSTYPFPGIEYMRLIVWKERESQITQPTKAASAGQLVHVKSYSLPFMAGVCMDFYSRGPRLRPASAMALAQILSHRHVVEEEELFTIEEILNDHWGDPLDQDNTIDNAQVGDLNGTQALAIEWTDVCRKCRRIAVYMDCDQDGTTVQEIHFCAPLASFDLAKKYFSEVLRSLQWQQCAVGPHQN
jgi:hypothetical protein